MLTFTEILGGVVILVMLGMAASEIWLYNHPESQGLPVTPRRLRRRLTGAFIVIAMIGAFTLAGKNNSPSLKLGLYLGSILSLFVLFALVLADLRETTRQAIREQLDMSPEELEKMMSDPEVRAAVERLTQMEKQTTDQTEDT